LWPLSRKAFPKQFIPLVGNRSLLTLTLARARVVAGPGAVITCVSAEDHRFLVADAAAACGEASVQQILEPEARNTAAAIALAALAANAPDAVLLICPADHHIPDAAAFMSSVRGALAAAGAGALVTFGIVPSFPSTGYGYIEQGQPAGAGFRVRRFVEKPPHDQALAMLSHGGFFWNAGIFLARADAWIGALQTHAPDILDACRQALSQSRRDGDFLRPGSEAFASCRSESIDYAVMEKSDNVVVFPFLGAWSDVGSWNAVADMAQAGEAGNRSSGDATRAHHLLASDTYIHASGGRPVVALGTENILIVDTPDALLVADRRHAESVKQVVARLEALDANEAFHHRRVARPWGWYDSVDVGGRHQVKRITVKPGAALSLQMHHHRAEHWVVVSGVAEVTNGDQVLILRENESTFIPIGQRHRLANPGSEPLEIIEVQSGAYLGEDDIVRFDDVYGRN
jgi:mannose-1-phosphate guanylyltransferase/mannose-6-phosphate isomerase